MEDGTDELRRLEQVHAAAGRAARAASQQGAELRASSAQLTAVSEPLIGVLDAVRALHTSHNWEGAAATRSRLRLDALEQRCSAALAAIDGILSDLDDQSRMQAGIADRAYAEQRRLGPRLHELREELGAFPGVR